MSYSKKYNIFILGAGFSVPAGLPVASALYKLVKEKIEENIGKNDTKFHQSLYEYLDYKLKCENIKVDPNEVDLEDFLSFLDIEHFLGLKGSDTLSSHGNYAQCWIKQYIGQTIHNATPDQCNLPQIYYDFAQLLKPGDLVITLNYDVVLERSLDHLGKSYSFSFSDSEPTDIIILKLHGSLDWFSDLQHQRAIEEHKKQGVNKLPPDPIFNNRDKYSATPLIKKLSEGADEQLKHVFRVRKLDLFYGNYVPRAIPLILSPSHMKIVYAEPFLDLWFGLGDAGTFNSSLSIIGFSLPEHDKYLKVLLYKILGNYQEMNWDDAELGIRKDFVKLIDFRKNQDEKKLLLKNYQFIDFDKARLFMEGFTAEAVQFLASNLRVH
ncbi:hypothetical protein BCT86_13015 [Vibrio breoganii]|uniref:SIR2 family protein n=1 Tax=Vibrio breoganii TaxID=553239 RepID=UPI000C85264A|nr:SIR2 family protein [Vibrio breoganii]PML05252.1 hypothetical protein BCT86_13015 [Vibrio breoganii]